MFSMCLKLDCGQSSTNFCFKRCLIVTTRSQQKTVRTLQPFLFAARDHSVPLYISCLFPTHRSQRLVVLTSMATWKCSCSFLSCSASSRQLGQTSPAVSIDSPFRIHVITCRKTSAGRSTRCKRQRANKGSETGTPRLSTIA